jgi:GT2 family glycosyltransferase
VETQKAGNNMIKTAIVILNWNGIAYLKKFLGTIVRYSINPETDIYVADNGSSDGSADWLEENFKEVRLIRLARNYGFAEGYNRAIDQIDAEYYLLINSDIEVTEGWLQPLVTFMELNRDTAACQPKILSYNRKDHFEHAGAAGGFIDIYGYPFCRGRILNITERDEGQYNDQADLFWSSGACMIVRADAWRRCGGFDADFFAHMEEIDLCWRFNRAGFRAVYIPLSTVYHIGGGSLAYDSPFKVYLNFRNSLFMLFKNLPDDRLFQILLVRMILDGLAAFMFLFKGRPGYSKAVLKAHIGFYKSIAVLRRKREKVKKLGNSLFPGLILNKSIIFEFYFKGIKTYSRL